VSAQHVRAAFFVSTGGEHGTMTLRVIVPTRFRFAEFVLSPRQRRLLRNGSPVPLIPKYFDLLHLLVVRRYDAVSKHVIFSEVWSDVVVSDGALAQAIRTLRRTLGDDSRDPRFIRTVSRHGYQFVWSGVIEEADEGGASAQLDSSDTVRESDRMEPLLDELMAATSEPVRAEDAARDAAEELHGLGTGQAMARLVERPGHARAVAVMRDARWTVPGAGKVPLLSDPEAVRAVVALIRLRASNIGRIVARKWAGAALGGAIGGAAAGLCGGLVLWLAPLSSARPQSALALAAIGAAIGGLGAAGVGAGLAAAEALARSRRELALAISGAIAGAVVDMLAHLLLESLLDGLFGVQLPFRGGAVEGLVIGGSAGTGYALGTAQPPGGGLAAPTGSKRVGAVAIVALCCASAATALALFGYPLVGGVIHEIARASNANLVLGPLGRLIGEPDFGPFARALLSAVEGGTFGATLAWGFTRRPRPSA
jgi:DNA-binding winged helix-turn-helix (wHTH) protein